MKRLNLITASAMTTVMARAFDNSTAAGNAAKRVDPVLAGVGKITMPTRVSKRGSETKYPFDTLTEVGMAFGVKNKTAEQLQSVVNNANRKAQVDKRDDAGNVVYHTKELSDGNGGVTKVPDTSKPVKVATKKFFAHNVDAAYKKANAAAFAKDGPFEGATALVFREA